MKTFFEELFEYNYYFNQKLISTLIENEKKASERAFRLFNHIINSHQIWNSKLLNKPSFTIFEMHPMMELQHLDAANYQNTWNILQQISLSQSFKYTNFKGEIFTDLVRDILFQVINHSTYHRAQIATECRQSGIEPLLTDYIFYTQNKKKNNMQ